jgi:hypothetical protein
MTDCERLWDALLTARVSEPGGWLADAYRLNLMAHSRVADLRRDKAAEIECKRFAAKDFRYRIVSAPGLPPLPREDPMPVQLVEDTNTGQLRIA